MMGQLIGSFLALAGWESPRRPVQASEAAIRSASVGRSGRFSHARDHGDGAASLSL